MQGGALTPLYAAPEQIRGATISTLTDVYSLGVVLYELLSGVLPYRASTGVRPTLVEVLETFGRGELPRVSQNAPENLRSALSGDLDTITAKALRLAPDDRYASVKHLADDLQRFLDRRPIAAQRAGLLYSARLAFARHRLAGGVAAVGLLFASFVCSAMSMRYFGNATLVVSMPVASPERKRLNPLATHYVQRAGHLYSWSLRLFLMVVPAVAGIVHPLSLLPATVALLVALRFFDHPTPVEIA